MLRILNSHMRMARHFGEQWPQEMCMFKAGTGIAATCSNGSIFHRHQQLRLQCQVPTETAMPVPTAVMGSGQQEIGCESIAATSSR